MNKREMSAALAAEIQDWIDAGNAITICPPQKYRRNGNARYKGRKGGICPPHMGLVRGNSPRANDRRGLQWIKDNAI